MDFHPKDLPISKMYDVKNEDDAVEAVEDMVNLGFKEKKEGFKVLMPKETIRILFGYTLLFNNTYMIPFLKTKISLLLCSKKLNY